MLRRTATGLVLALTVTAAGCTSPAEPSTSDDTPSPEPSPPATAVEVEAVADQLAALVVTERPRPDGSYERDAFGSSWADVDDNGCNQRDDVLLRDAVAGTAVTAPQGRCDHDVLAGTWVDPYTGRTLTFDDLKDPGQAQAVQIDHVVPLAEAWLSGAALWPEQRRVAFANDVDGLLAVDGPTNASKGSYDPAAWRPRKGYQCEYATRWIATKHRWELTVDASEVEALREMLGYC